MPQCPHRSVQHNSYGPTTPTHLPEYSFVQDDEHSIIHYTVLHTNHNTRPLVHRLFASANTTLLSTQVSRPTVHRAQQAPVRRPVVVLSVLSA
jgi:hypothetical protein